MKRKAIGASLVVVPFVVHAVLESTGKGWLGIVPEPIVDFAFGTVMLVGVLMLLPMKSLASRRLKP